MSSKVKPQGDCPKCGGKQWYGPHYKPSIFIKDVRRQAPDYLEFKCVECGYPLEMPCLDSTPPSPPPDDFPIR